MHIIDSHIHCGVQNVRQPFEVIRPLLSRAGVASACLFAPVEDIYHRYAPDFDDNRQWRRCRERAHAYLLDLAAEQSGIYPYYFVWNDFIVEDLNKPFAGIKWHHHAGEPPYRYEDQRCTEMIEAICREKMPVVLEETLGRTLWFIEQVCGSTPVIIPHLGLLNGGFERLLAASVWEEKSVYADTALAGPEEIRIFLDRYGSDRLLFGSDYPFGMPGSQLQQLKAMGLSDGDLEMICGENIRRILRKVRRGRS
jgi:hypothetical protein